MSADRPQKPASSKAPNDEELLAGAIPIDALEEADDNAEPRPAAQADRAARGEQGAKPSGKPPRGGGLEPIEFEENDDSSDEQRQTSRIRAMEGRPEHKQKPWRRQPNVNGQGATHVKTFVAKLRYEAIEHLDEQINDWLDAHPECEVKFVTTAIGPLIGKLKEDALFVNVWV